MLLGEPPSTQGDLHFRLFGIPVRVHPFFWIAALLLGARAHQGEPGAALIWVAVVFVSILVHELGHAAMQTYYRGYPRITLYGFGGLASCGDCDRSPRSQILILLAGPFAGFALAGVVIAILAASGHVDGFRWGLVPVDWMPFDIKYAIEHRKPSLRDSLVYFSLFVNIAWGVLNMLPVYPLDGGQIARELFTLGNPRRGIVLSLQISMVTAGIVVLYAIQQNQPFMALMFGFLAYGSYQTLQNYRNHWR